MRASSLARINLGRQAATRAALLPSAVARFSAPTAANLGAVRLNSSNAHFKIPKVANEANLSCEHSGLAVEMQ